MGKSQEQKYIVLKPIKYKNPDSDLFRKTVLPSDNLILAFPHLSDTEIALLTKTRTIAPVSAVEIKAFEKALAENVNDRRGAINKEAKELAEAKKRAMAKQIQIDREN